MTAFCALNRDAATAYRKQHPDLALRIAARAAKLESGTAARRLVEVARHETSLDAGELDLDGIYERVVRSDRRPADELARSVSIVRRALGKPLADIGVSTIVGTVVRLDDDAAEIVSADGERYTLPAFLPAGALDVGSPVSVRVELLGDGALWTVVEPAWSDLPAARGRGRPLRSWPEVLGAGLPLPARMRGLIARSAVARRLLSWPYVADPAGLGVGEAELLLSGAGARGLWPTVRAVGRSEVLEEIGAVRCPLLSLAGERDLIVPLADTSRLRRGLPAARTHVFAGCGHMPMLERPELKGHPVYKAAAVASFATVSWGCCGLAVVGVRRRWGGRRG